MNKKSISSLAGFPQVPAKMPQSLLNAYKIGKATSPHAEILTLDGFKVVPKYGTTEARAGEICNILNSADDATKAFSELTSREKEILVTSCRERAVLRSGEGEPFEFQASPFTGFEGGNRVTLYGFVDTYNDSEFVKPTGVEGAK